MLAPEAPGLAWRGMPRRNSLRHRNSLGRLFQRQPCRRAPPSNSGPWSNGSRLGPGAELLAAEDGEEHLNQLRKEYGRCVSDPDCWTSGYTYEVKGSLEAP